MLTLLVRASTLLKIAFAEFKERKGGTGRTKELPLGSVPVLTVQDGTVVTQSMAMGRYAAKLANLYPSEPLEALFVD